MTTAAKHVRRAESDSVTTFLPVLGGIMVFYIVVAETAKTFFHCHSAA